jgi:hypothetical protein
VCFLPQLQTVRHALGDHCVVIADEEPDTRVLVHDAVRRHRRGLIAAAVEPRLLDNVLFVPSHDSAGVQAVDLLAFLHRRIENGDDDTPERRSVHRETVRIQAIYKSLIADATLHPAPAVR